MTPNASRRPSARTKSPIGIAALEDQNVPEAPVPHQHGGQGRHHGQFHDERRDQHLPEGKLCGSRHALIYLILSARVN